MITSNVTTLTLNDSEETVEFEKGYPYYFISNKSDTDMYVSLSPDITPDTEGVYTVSAGSTERIGAGYSLPKFYILGTGKVQIRGEQIAALPSFKRGGKGGDNAGANDLVTKFSTHNLLVDYESNTSICTKTQNGEIVTYSIQGHQNAGWYQITKGGYLKKGKMYKLIVNEDYYGCGELGIAMSYTNTPSSNELGGNFETTQKMISNGNTNAKYFYIAGNYDMGSDIYFGIWIKITLEDERAPYSFNIGLFEEI